MPFKDFGAGDVLSAADVDNYLMRQTVMTFADSSARDTALTGVLDEGMLTYLEDTDTFTVYDGSAWKRIGVAATGQLIQHDNVGLALDASGRASVTFDTAFSSLPAIVLSVRYNTTQVMSAHLVANSATGFTVQVDSDGAPVASETRQVNWIAIGPA